jgi:outer membrane receptor protein involved in Fe transport
LSAPPIRVRKRWTAPATARTTPLGLGSRGLDGVIRIQSGDRIPLVPQHLLKAFADYQPTKKLSLDLDFVAVSTSYARGNENNQSQPDGVYYLGPGTSPGYGLVNAGAHYQLLKRLQLFVQINNLLDHPYYTAAQLGPTGFTNQGTFIARPFPHFRRSVARALPTVLAVPGWDGPVMQFLQSCTN